MYRNEARTRIATLLVCLFFAVSAIGCSSTSGRSYKPGEARKAQTIQQGTILAIDEVTIEQDSTLVGPGIGGAAGGAIGSTIGGGSGRILAIVGGAIVGALTGAVTEKAVRSESAFEFTVELENGSAISVVQAVDDDYAVGDKVRVLTGEGRKVRIVRIK